MSRKVKIEICSGSIQSALSAEKGGADRIELCSALSEGGLTPSPGMMKYVCNALSIPVFMLIRPRAGDFCYTGEEFESMLTDIISAKNYGAKGIVSGVLNADGSVDTLRMKKIVEISRPLPVTFHRAFDHTRDPFEALNDIIDSGCRRVLTSGQATSAMDGAILISEMIRKTSDRLKIMPGAGINPTNFLKLAELTGALEFHLSASRKYKGSMIYQKQGVKMSDNKESEFEIKETDPDIVSRICRLADNLN